MKKIKVTIWNEFRHEKESENIAKIYPEGIHKEIAKGLSKNANLEIKFATLDDEEHGLTDEVLENTDVLIWWGHRAHSEVRDEIVEKVYNKVMDGMGMVVLHSGHASKIFRKLCGTQSQNLRWRDDGEKERLWNIMPNHPIAQGIDEFFEIEREEMYGECFQIPTPDELIFLSWFAGGEVFRSGFVLNRGLGKIFYFRPGHEEFPTFKDENVIKVISNACEYTAKKELKERVQGKQSPIENIEFKPKF